MIPVVRTAALRGSLESCCTVITELPLIFPVPLWISVGMNQKMKIVFLLRRKS